jgi:hypothetical protein
MIKTSRHVRVESMFKLQRKSSIKFVIFLQIFFWCDHEIAVSGDLEVINVQNFLPTMVAPRDIPDSTIHIAY